MLPDILNTLFLLIAVIDPFGSVPVYLEATKNFDLKHKKKLKPIFFLANLF